MCRPPQSEIVICRSESLADCRVNNGKSRSPSTQNDCNGRNVRFAHTAWSTHSDLDEKESDGRDPTQGVAPHARRGVVGALDLPVVQRHRTKSQSGCLTSCCRQYDVNKPSALRNNAITPPRLIGSFGQAAGQTHYSITMRSDALCSRGVFSAVFNFRGLMHYWVMSIGALYQCIGAQSVHNRCTISALVHSRCTISALVHSL